MAVIAQYLYGIFGFFLVFVGLMLFVAMLASVLISFLDWHTLSGREDPVLPSAHLDHFAKDYFFEYDGVYPFLALDNKADFDDKQVYKYPDLPRPGFTNRPANVVYGSESPYNRFRYATSIQAADPLQLPDLQRYDRGPYVSNPPVLLCCLLAHKPVAVMDTNDKVVWVDTLFGFPFELFLPFFPLALIPAFSVFLFFTWPILTHNRLLVSVLVVSIVILVLQQYALYRFTVDKISAYFDPLDWCPQLGPYLECMWEIVYYPKRSPHQKW